LTPLIQIADLTGVYGVSFWVVAVNVLIKELIDAIAVKKMRIEGKLVIFPMLLMMAVLIYGVVRMAQPHKTGIVKVGVIQGNIDLPTHWDESAWMSIIHKHLAMSNHAAVDNPDLIVWPETAFPGFLWEDALLLTELKKFIEDKNIPVLFGTVIEKDNLYYNSSVLLSKNSTPDDVYSKIHLVPYGEYIPFRKYMPFLSYVIPIDDFSPGQEFKIIESNGARFASLICFEDTVPGLTRRFVDNGAQLLITLSNDAWFRDTSEPWMHLEAAIFRSVENRRTLVRASNVGVSGFIDQMGRIMSIATNPDGKSTYVEAVAVQEVSLNDKITFYTRFGDVFVYSCIALLGLAFFKRRFKQV